jgi:hypothetical protein
MQPPKDTVWVVNRAARLMDFPRLNEDERVGRDVMLSSSVVKLPSVAMLNINLKVFVEVKRGGISGKGTAY